MLNIRRSKVPLEDQIIYKVLMITKLKYTFIFDDLYTLRS